MRIPGVVLAGVLASGACLAAPPTAQCTARARAALQAFTHGEYADVPAHFAPTIASAVTADKLQTAWQQIEAAVGPLQKVGELAPRTVGGQDALVAPIRFAKGELDALVACDAHDQLTTFRIVPPSMVESSSAPSVAEVAMARLIAVTRANEHAPHEPVKAALGPDGIRVTPLAVPSPFGPLPGALTLPSGKGPFPAVVLVQGSGSSDMDETIGPNKPFRDIAAGLARAGIASLRYDKRAFVYGPEVAANAKFTVDEEVTDDALTALRLLAQQHSIDPRRVFVLGHSEGAMLVPRIVKRDPRVAGGIMLAAPARPLLAVLAGQVRGQGAKAGESKAAVAANIMAIESEQALLDKADPRHPPEGEFNHAPQTWWLSLHDYHPVAVARSLSRPLLILQGGSDFQVSPKLDFYKWKQVLAGKSNVTFHLYPGLSHLFRPAGKTGTVEDYLKPGATDPQVIRDIANWIKAQPAR